MDLANHARIILGLTLKEDEGGSHTMKTFDVLHSLFLSFRYFCVCREFYLYSNTFLTPFDFIFSAIPPSISQFFFNSRYF